MRLLSEIEQEVHLRRLNHMLGLAGELRRIPGDIMHLQLRDAQVVKVIAGDTVDVWSDDTTPLKLGVPESDLVRYLIEEVDA